MGLSKVVVVTSFVLEAYVRGLGFSFVNLNKNSIRRVLFFSEDIL